MLLTFIGWILLLSLSIYFTFLTLFSIVASTAFNTGKIWIVPFLGAIFGWYLTFTLAPIAVMMK